MTKHGDDFPVPRINAGLCDGCTAVAAERQRIIDEMVTIAEWLILECYANDLKAVLAAVSAKLKEAKG